jgi:hypothetical protein
MKAARERAWLIGNPVWMRQWLLKEARRSTSRALEFKSGYAVRCRDMALRHGRSPEAKVGNPHWENQPRVPAGNSILSGRWTQLAGDEPGPGQGGGPSSHEPPELPVKRPATAQERNQKAKELAKAGRRPGKAGAILLLIEAASWGWEIAATVTSYWDEPKTFEALRDAAMSPAAGYDIHHIVEKALAKEDGYPVSQIDGPENLVRIPRMKHWEINGWYATKNDDFGGLSPREYLRGKSWEEKTSIGQKASIDAGVLKP